MRYQLNRYMMFPQSKVRRTGSALEMEEDRIFFRCTPPLEAGELIDWEILLPDTRSIVGGLLRVEAVHRGRLAGDLVQEGRIVEMVSPKRDALMEWVARQTVTSTPVEQPEHVPSGLLPSGSTRPLPTLVPDPAGSRPPGQPLGSSEVTPARVKPRERMSRAIVDATGSLPDRRRVNPERVEPRRSWRDPLPAPPSARPAPPPPRAVDPLISVSARGLSLPRIEVRYRSHQAYVCDYDSVIRSSGFFVPLLELGALSQRGARAVVQLDLPGGQQLHCLAEVVRPLPNGIGLQLELSAEQHAELERVRNAAR